MSLREEGGGRERRGREVGAGGGRPAQCVTLSDCLTGELHLGYLRGEAEGQSVTTHSRGREERTPGTRKHFEKVPFSSHALDF